MRREGYEFQVGKPQVLVKEEDGIKYEPVEELVIDVAEPYSGKVIELVTQKKGDLLVMEPKGDLLHLAFEIPSRGLIGLRSRIVTATAGNAIITHRFIEFRPYKGDILERKKGSLVSMNEGQSLAFAIDRLQDRGRFFIKPGTKVYQGMVVGESTRDQDLNLNVTKGKKMSNMRASGTDDNVKIPPPVLFSLEEAMEYIRDDEYLELTPESIRMRKIKFKA